MSGLLVDRAALEALLSDPWSYHGGPDEDTYRQCIGCGQRSDEEHASGCPVPTLRAALSTPAPAGAVAKVDEPSEYDTVMANIEQDKVFKRQLEEMAAGAGCTVLDIVNALRASQGVLPLAMPERMP